MGGRGEFFRAPNPRATPNKNAPAYPAKSSNEKTAMRNFMENKFVIAEKSGQKNGEALRFAQKFRQFPD